MKLAQRVALAEEQLRLLHEDAVRAQTQRVSSKKEALSEIKDLIAYHRENLLGAVDEPITGSRRDEPILSGALRNSSSPQIGRSSRLAQYLRNTAHMQYPRTSLGQGYHANRGSQESPEGADRRSTSFVMASKGQGLAGSGRLG